MKKRFNLLIQGETAINKLESLPERSKGAYVSDLIEKDVQGGTDIYTRLHKLEAEVAEIKRSMEVEVGK